MDECFDLEGAGFAASALRQGRGVDDWVFLLRADFEALIQPYLMAVANHQWIADPSQLAEAPHPLDGLRSLDRAASVFRLEDPRVMAMRLTRPDRDIHAPGPVSEILSSLPPIQANTIKVLPGAFTGEDLSFGWKRRPAGVHDDPKQQRLSASARTSRGRASPVFPTILADMAIHWINHHARSGSFEAHELIEHIQARAPQSACFRGIQEPMQSKSLELEESEPLVARDLSRLRHQALTNQDRSKAQRFWNFESYLAALESRLLAREMNAAVDQPRNARASSKTRSRL
ncbi:MULTISPECIES: hypothetical protein [unclassified Thioalkalivibrio]|uniref:hypothetical protein n=1 Tax=unclassified Thioalkalivibrio TaxID=2621013 RepID=UPI00039DF971|nr:MULTISPECIES: hypothetical protein [unclassified Thioalkalivibrio]